MVLHDALILNPDVVFHVRIVSEVPADKPRVLHWTSTVAIIPTQYHEPPPNARPHYACGRPLSHEQCKEGKIQQNSECFFVFTLLYQLAYPLCASRAPIPTPIPLILPLVWIVIILLLRSLRDMEPPLRITVSTRALPRPDLNLPI